MPRKPPRRTRERILGVALRMFNDQGEPNVTTTSIAEEMNISPGNLYYHFRNKDDIVNGLFEQFEQEIDPLLELPLHRETHFEDAWLFLHLLFEAIWRHRFVYRDLNDLLSRNRRLEMRFRTIVDRKARAAQALCRSLVGSQAPRATDDDITTLATNMAVVTTYWLSFEYIRNARRFGDAGYQSAAMARGAHQVLSLVAPWLDDDARALFDRLSHEYLR